MGKAERRRQQSTREKIAAQQAAARQAEMRRRVLIAAGSVFVVLVVVIALIVWKTLSKPSTPSANGGTPGTATAASVTSALASVPAATLDKVGVGPAYPAQGSVYPHTVQTVRPAVSTLTSGGKPQVVYVGADYCPYCAAQRWALVVALSRFGTFSGLQLIHSSSADVYPNTPTLSFAGSSYTSKYVVFTSTEAETVDRKPLEPLTALDKTLMAKYDAPPYVQSSGSGSFPFVDLANKYVIIGASYAASLLAGLTWQQIGADVANPSSVVGAAIDAAANHITAAICKATNNQPANICTSSGVTSASGSI